MNMLHTRIQSAVLAEAATPAKVWDKAASDASYAAALEVARTEAQARYRRAYGRDSGLYSEKGPFGPNAAYRAEAL